MAIIDYVNSFISGILNYVLYPADSLGKFWGLVFISLLSGVILLLFYGKISDQEGLKKTKTKIYACILEAVLYRSNIKLSLAAQGKMFLCAFVYLRYAFVPLMVLAIPCIMLLSHLNERYGYTGIMEGESAVITMKVSEADAMKRIFMAEADNVEFSPPVRVLESNEISWRADATGTGKSTLRVGLKDGSVTFEKPLFLGSGNRAVSGYSFSSHLKTLFFPEGVVIPSYMPIEEVFIQYPEKEYWLLGMKMHWVIVFLIFSVVAGLVGSKVFGVEI